MMTNVKGQLKRQFKEPSKKKKIIEFWLWNGWSHETAREDTCISQGKIRRSQIAVLDMCPDLENFKSSHVFRGSKLIPNSWQRKKNKKKEKFLLFFLEKETSLRWCKYIRSSSTFDVLVLQLLTNASFRVAVIKEETRGDFCPESTSHDPILKS